MKYTFLTIASLSLLTISCKKKSTDETVTPSIRPAINYSNLKLDDYSINFKNSNGDSTVDRSIGRSTTNLFLGFAEYIKTSVDSSKALNFTKLNNYFTNSSNPYTGSYSVLNTSGLSLKNLTAQSFVANESEKIKSDIEIYIKNLALSSDSVSKTAQKDKAGCLSFNSTTGTRKYLVDKNGIEWGQVVQKALIGTFQLDNLCNVLLANLEADNTTLFNNKYTALEQNWDKAYGIVTQRNIYGQAFSGTSSGETQLGAYVWEYNPYNAKTKKALEEINLAFLKGRAAVANNDKTTFKIQSDYLRLTFEKSLAKAALGYLSKCKTLSTDAEKAHALGEGLGFIYALRACKLSGADVNFSDGIFNSLLSAGYWNMSIASLNDAEQKIKAKFNL